MSRNAPVGILDSGVGGLTIVRSIQALLPEEQLVFFGDTAHVPYGDKSSHAIREYTKRIIHHLFEHYKCKAVVVACNTASAIANKSLRAGKDTDKLIVNVIDPVVDHIASLKKVREIGVIGTKRTISSRAYPNRIRACCPSVRVRTKATPLLAPMVEEGFFNNNISQTLINAYLDQAAFENIEKLILGCTHYPLIREEVERYFMGRVDVIDSPVLVASALKNVLKNNDLLSERRGAEDIYRVSDYTRSFEKTTEVFFGRTVRLKEFNLWKG